MKKIIDNFSGHSEQYQKFRPDYPDELFEAILELTPGRNLLWDCGTGNGQVAVALSPHFTRVYATDVSEKQIAYAMPGSNIEYQVTRSERTDFATRQFDLITVGQALHWFDIPAFYREVRRVGKPGGILAVWGYNVLRIDAQTNPLIDHFHHHTIRSYWDKERQLVDDSYTTIPFPFREIDIAKSFYITRSWTINQLENYLNTWSGVQNYIRREGKNPVTPLINEIASTVGWDEPRAVRWPVFLRIGIIDSK